MKTKEYPIKETFKFEMDRNKIWWLKGNIRRDGLILRTDFPTTNNNEVEESVYVDIFTQTYKYCEEHNFYLEGDGRVVFLDWNRTPQNMNGFPTLLFPYCRKDFTRGSWSYEPPPYYGNPHYKKYIEDNNGECPLPLPEDMKWWEE